ncbi:MAG: diphthine--ammonia ligase [Nitrososphaeria archaeon]|nr:diphthine--ammonia ligase [Nitrososphaeria archaeon]
MKVTVLFSGGKDSCLALQKTMSSYEIACLVTVFSENRESYMFHVPNIELTPLQAKALNLPLVTWGTKGIKEEEVEDLKNALSFCKKEYGVEGVVSGAIRSSYQLNRVKKVCSELGLLSINPLWLRDEVEILNEVLENSYHVIISAVFAYPLGKELLGKRLDKELVSLLEGFRRKYGLNPAGEGGEIETTVLDTPFFSKRIEIIDFEIDYRNYSGVFKIKSARLVDKN